MKLETLTKLREAATAISLIAVPLIVVWIQWSSGRDTVGQQYVSMAVGVLQSSAPGEDTVKEAALRHWATEVIISKSPVKMSDTLQRQLEDGEIRLSGFASSSFGLGSAEGYAGVTLVPSNAPQPVAHSSEPEGFHDRAKH